MAYGISPVQLALRDLAGTVGQGFTDIGRQRLQTEESGLKRALVERDLARQTKMDELQLPGLQQAAQKAKDEMALDNEPVTIGSITGDISGMQFFTNVPKGMERSPIEDLAGVFNAKIDTKEGSPTRGMMIKQDGTPVLRKDFKGKADMVSAVLMAHSDAYHVHEDQLSRQYERLSQNPELMKTSEGQKLLGNMKNTVEWLDKPELQLKTLMMQKQMLERFQGQSPIFDKNLERIDKQIEKVEGRIEASAKAAREQAEAERKQAWEEKKLAIEEGGRNWRAELDINKPNEKENPIVKDRRKFMMDAYNGAIEFGADIEVAKQAANEAGILYDQQIAAGVVQPQPAQKTPSKRPVNIGGNVFPAGSRVEHNDQTGEYRITLPDGTQKIIAPNAQRKPGLAEDQKAARSKRAEEKVNQPAGTQAKPGAEAPSPIPQQPTNNMPSDVQTVQGITFGVLQNRYVVKEGDKWRQPTRDEKLIIQKAMQPKGQIPVGIKQQGQGLSKYLEAMQPKRY